MYTHRPFLVLALFLASTSFAWAERGRVKVVRNGAWDYAANAYDPDAPGRTVVTDQGTLLRGTAFWCVTFHARQIAYARDFANWEKIPARGFNSVRLALNHWEPDKFNTPAAFTDEAWLAQIDQWVDWAAQLGLYVIIDHHEEGKHTQSRLRTFWTWIAPRYKDRTHVLYEIANEPVGWKPSQYTAQDIADQQEIYELIRLHAPDTHIILLSFAVPEPGMSRVAGQLKVDWANASVAFHGYWVNSAEPINELKRNYPVINTEFCTPRSSFKGAAYRLDGFEWQPELMERLKISWNVWDVNYRPEVVERAWDPLLEHAKANGYIWEPDTPALR